MTLLNSWTKENEPPDEIINETIDLSFSSIKTLSKQKDMKEPDGIIANRRDVLEMFALLIGKISEHKFIYTVDRFYQELDNVIDSNSIPESTALLSGIRYIKLSIVTQKDIQDTEKFINKITSLINKKSKPDILMSACKLVGDVLIPLTNYTESKDVDYTQFRSNVTELFYSSKKLWKKLKEPAPALIMEVGILCNGKKEFLSQQPFSILERLSKLLKINDRNRPTILDCIYYLVMTLFDKYDNPNYDIGFDLLLEKVREIFPSPSKKVIIPQFESVEAYVDIAVLLSFFRFDYVVTNFILAALNNVSDNNFERLLIGLKSFNNIADRCMLCFDRTNINRQDVRTAAYSSRKISLNKKPVTAGLSLDNILACRNAIEQVFIYIDSQVGDLLMYNQSQVVRVDVDGIKLVNKEKQPLIHILRSIISSLRRVPVVNMAFDRWISILSKYCFHIDKEIRRESKELIIGLLKTKPTCRADIIETFGKFILSIPEGQSIFIRKALEILNELLNVWYDPVVLNILDPDETTYELKGNFSKTFPGSIVESVGLILLCNHNFLVRNDAYILLEWVKKVNEGLPRDICDSVPRVYMMIKENEKQLIQQSELDRTTIYSDNQFTFQPIHSLSKSTSLSSNSTSSNNNLAVFNYGNQNNQTLYTLLTSLHTDDLQLSIGRIIGEIINCISPNCSEVLRVIHQFSNSKLEFLNVNVLQSKRIDTPSFMEQLIWWRNYTIISLSTSDKQSTESIKKLLPAFYSPFLIIRECFLYSLQYASVDGLVILFDLLLNEQKKKREQYRVEISYLYRFLCEKSDLIITNERVIKKIIDWSEECISFLNTTPSTSSGDYQHTLISQYIISYNQNRGISHIIENLYKRNIKISNYLTLEARESFTFLLMKRSGYGNCKNEQKQRDNKIKELLKEPQNIQNLFSTYGIPLPTTNSASSGNSLDQTQDNTVGNGLPSPGSNQGNGGSSSGNGIIPVDEVINHIQYWNIRCLYNVLRDGFQGFGCHDIHLFNGPLFHLITDIFENCENVKLTQFIINLLKYLLRTSTNEIQESMFRICIDQSFQFSNQRISKGYFESIVDIITSNIDVPCKLPVLLTLAIHKLADENRVVRKNSVKLLHWMSIRFFRTAEYTFKLFRNIISSDSYIKQISEISKCFSMKHPELRYDILLEIFHRIPTVDREGQRRMIIYTIAWFHDVRFYEFDEETLKDILQKFTVFTLKYGEQRSDLLEDLWKELAKQDENVEFIIKFMIDCVIDRQRKDLLIVLKKICIYIMRVAPSILCKLLIAELNIQSEQQATLSRTASNTNIAYLHSPSSSNPSNTSTLSPENTWSFDFIFVRTQVYSPLPRRSISLILLTELIPENMSIFTNDLPILLHSVFVDMDSLNVEVSNHAKLLIENLLFSQFILNNKENSDGFKLVKILLDQIEQSGEDPLWPNESVSLQNLKVQSFDKIQYFIKLSLQILSYSNLPYNLQEKWSEISLDFAFHSHSEHIVSRSLQIYRVFDTSLNEDILRSITSKLLSSIKSRSPVNVQTSVEIMETLMVMVKKTPKTQLLSVPQLFWLGASMLNTVIPIEFSVAIELVSTLIDYMKICDMDMQKVLLSTIPQDWHPQFNGVIDFLLKGLCSPKTENVSRKLLSKITIFPCIYPLHSSKDLRVLGNMIGLFPHLLTGMGRQDTLIIAEDLSNGLLMLGEEKFGKLFSDYQKFTTSPEGMRRFIYEIALNISEQYFPEHEIYVFSVLIEIMEHGLPEHKRSILSLLEALLGTIDLQKSSLNSEHLALLAPITKYLEHNLWNEALKVIEVVLQKSSIHEKQKNWKQVSDFSDLKKLQSFEATWERPVNLQSLIKALEECLNPTVLENPPEPFIPIKVTIAPRTPKQLSLSSPNLSRGNAPPKQWTGTIKPTNRPNLKASSGSAAKVELGGSRGLRNSSDIEGSSSENEETSTSENDIQEQSTGDSENSDGSTTELLPSSPSVRTATRPAPRLKPNNLSQSTSAAGNLKSLPPPAPNRNVGMRGGPGNRGPPPRGGFGSRPQPPPNS